MNNSCSQAVGRFSLVAVAGLVAVSCGSTDDAPNATALPDVADFDASLAAALDNSTGVDALRVTTYQAQTLRIEALGVDSQGALDLDNPTVVVESAASGASSVLFDLTAQFDTMRATNPALADLGRIELQMWTAPDRVVIDTTDYAAIEEINPGQLGPFSPGVFMVDTSGDGDVAGADLATLIGGTAVPDIETIASGLLDKLESPEEQDETGVYIGSMSFADLLEVQGTDAQQAAGGAAAGIAGALGVDGQVLADYYASFYEETDVDVVVTIGESDILESIQYDADLSSLYDGFGDILSTNAAFADLPDGQAEEIFEAFAEAEFALEAQVEFEPDDSIVIEIPTGDLEDRTEAMIAFFEQSGIDFSE